MPSLQIRNLNQDIYDAIVALAKEENRSIVQQSVVLLRSALKANAQKAQLKQVLDVIDSIPIRRARRKMPAPEMMIREDRDR